MVGVWFPFFIYVSICAHDPFPCTNLVVRPNGVSHLLRELLLQCEITTTYECRRPKFDVDANQPLQQEVLLLTPSCVAAVDVLLMAKLFPRRLSAVLSHIS